MKTLERTGWKITIFPEFSPRKELLGRMLDTEAGMRMAQSNQRHDGNPYVEPSTLPAFNCAILGEIF